MKRKMFLFSIIIIISLFACAPDPTATPKGEYSLPNKISASHGGILSYEDVTLTIPSGALSIDQIISVRKLDAKPMGDEGDFVIPGDVYTIEADQDIFDSPIIVTIEYDPSLLPTDRSEGEIFGVFLYDGGWYRMLGEVNKDKNTITLQTLHASVWSWGFEKLNDISMTPYATALNCINNAKDPLGVPKTLDDAYFLRKHRIQEWEDTISSANISVEKLDDNLKAKLNELGIDVTKKVQGKIVLNTAMLVSKLAGVKDHEALIKVGENIAGVLYLVNSSIQSIETNMLTGDTLAEMVRIEAAQQRYMASEAYIYLLTNPDAKTIPTEYMTALLLTCSKEPNNSIIGTRDSVIIPAGIFLMGSGLDHDPIHSVTLNAFRMNTTEVTNGMYARCVESGACISPLSTSSHTRSDYYGNSEYDNYPVIYVNWNQASAYCAWTGGRLPTEAEWEYAARGGLEGKKYPWGDETPTCSPGAVNGARFAKCSPDEIFPDTIAVASFAPNGYGLYDMAGNVWEWTADWFDEYYYHNSPSNNPTGPNLGEYRVIRGGSFTNRYSDSMIGFVAIRGYYPPTDSIYYFIGFRCAGVP